VNNATGSGGWQGSFLGLSNVLDAGDLVFDPNAANRCVTGVGSFTCGVIMQGPYKTIHDDCFAALHGTVAVGGPCGASIECAPDGVCIRPADGGPGTCNAIRAAGAPCGDIPNDQEACTYIGSGVPPQFCDDSNPDAAAWTCQPAQANGASCYLHFACTSGVCGDLGTCDTQFTATDPGVPGGTCDAFTIRDAGGGG
jgi:hypothetical protein